MILSVADIGAYLKRICYDGPLEPSLEMLRGLHRAHVFSVPFENLDMHLGLTMPMDVGHAYRKIVERRRGGYCYELGPLFHALLIGLGFDAALLSARVYARGPGGDFDHVTSSVNIGGDGNWLVDVAFGRQPPLMPVGFESGREFTAEDGLYRIRRRDEPTPGEYIVMGSKDDGSKDGGGYDDMFGFQLIGRELGDFEDRAVWTQTSPDSVFTKAPLCTLPLGAGRITISGLNCIRSTGGQAEVQKLTPRERDDMLKDVFGIDLGGAKLPDGADVAVIPGRGSFRT